MTERAYLDLLQDILDNGVDRGDRTGTGTRSVFGRQIRFDLGKGFPLLTTKKVFSRGIIEELLWFLRGSTNAKELEDKNVNIWKEWGDPETREMGPIYSKQWRDWESPSHNPSDPIKHVDQIADLVHGLKTNPESRRHLVVAWNPGEIDRMALPPCHCLFQFYVRPMNNNEINDTYMAFRSSVPLFERPARVDQVTGAKGRQKTVADLEMLGLPTQKLDCQLYQRSADVFLGVPFNIASYALLTLMLAQQCGYAPGEFVHTFGDVHLYHNHFEQAQTQLARQPYEFPTMEITPAADIFSYDISNFKLIGYKSHPTIKGDVAV